MKLKVLRDGTNWEEVAVDADGCRTIRELSRRVHQRVGFEPRLIWRGRVLQDEDAMSEMDAVVVIPQPRPQQHIPETNLVAPATNVATDGGGGGGMRHRNAAAAQQPPPTAAAAAAAAPPAEDAVCRICLCGEDASLGRLFSPCRCTGTVRLVHVVCLNRWRRMSANPRSHLQCDQCGYQYNVSRTEFAIFLSSWRVVEAATAVALILSVILSGMVSKVCGLDTYFYKLVLWTPWWTGYYGEYVLDVIMCGLLCVGVGGFCFNVLSRGNFRENWWQMALQIGFMFMANGQVMVRVFVVFGLIYSLTKAYDTAKDLTTRALHKWGEVVMDVR